MPNGYYIHSVPGANNATGGCINSNVHGKDLSSTDHFLII